MALVLPWMHLSKNASPFVFDRRRDFCNEYKHQKMWESVRVMMKALTQIPLTTSPVVHVSFVRWRGVQVVQSTDLGRLFKFTGV